MVLKVAGVERRTIWPDPSTRTVRIIDQTRLPHAFSIVELRSLDDIVRAIREMLVRGAPLIGAAAAYGLALAMRGDSADSTLESASRRLLAARPTAVNLRWAVNRVRRVIGPMSPGERFDAAWHEAAAIADEDVAINQGIARHGLPIIEEITKRKGTGPVNILTHCNAGWLATVDWGTALAPVYAATRAGIDVHVWVDETRPRNQGASLTAWELQQECVPFKVVVDNAGGHLMQHGMVDMVIVGCDRVTARGDVCNKIGTYLKALAAKDNGVPFYVALPSPTIDWTVLDGLKEIPIEERDAQEVTCIAGVDESGVWRSIRLVPEGALASNFAFDVTPARYVTGLVTERGIARPEAEALKRLFEGAATAV